MVSRVLKKIIKTGKKPKPRPKGYEDALKARGAPRDAIRGILPSSFMDRRRVIGGAQAALRKQPKRPSSGYIEGIITGGVGTAITLKYLEKMKKDVKAKKADLKKAVEKHKEADKKRKEAYGKRAPKKDKNYGGR
jgi:hypothetical protein